jgi:ketosteroid isomerase-like protein
MTNTETIKKFYTSFSEGNAKDMIACYHEEIVFQDPAFGVLKGNRAKKMWEMLLSNKDSNIKITFNNINVDGDEGGASWIAEYVYGPKKRKVINKVNAQFKFKEGEITEHKDTFNLWKWSGQALGLVGHMIGWTPIMKKKIQSITSKKLNTYIEKTKVNQ